MIHLLLAVIYVLYQSGPAGFSAGGCVAFDLSGIWGPVSYSGVIFCIISVERCSPACKVTG